MATDVKPNAFARFGNDLHSGARSYPFVGKRRLWLLLAAVLMAVSVLIPAVGGGFNLGIDFRGGRFGCSRDQYCAGYDSCPDEQAQR